jgi:indole-3-glycerol phosphate synthase
VVAELARSTPEEGSLPQVDYAALAQALDDSDAAAIAVATDPVASSGSLADLSLVSRDASSPIVQRDLVLVREQLYQARLMGADAVLLHGGAVTPSDLKAFIELASSMHMAAPVEVARDDEMKIALAAGARIVVIPAFGQPHAALSLDGALSLLPHVPKTATALVRGPFYRPEDLAPLQGKADGVWICEPLVRAGDPAEFLRAFLASANKETSA